MKASCKPRSKFRRVEFFKKSDGSKPVADWLNTLDDERAQAVATGIRFFEEYPEAVVPTKFYEKISPNLWEIKAHYGKEQFRLFCFPDPDTQALIVAVHSFAKKTQTLRKQDIELAEARRKEFLARKKPAGR